MAAAHYLAPCTSPSCSKPTPTLSLSPKPIPNLQPSIKFRYPILSCLSLSSSSPSLKWHHPIQPRGGVLTVFAVVEEETAALEDAAEVNDGASEKEEEEGERKKKERPSELYVCNLPRSFEIPELLELFKPFGTVLSVEVSKNPETDISRGCGYVTMGSVRSARKAISQLDKSDVDGRELRVRFSVDMKSERRNPEVLNAAPKTVLLYESPYKLYVGNLAWSIKPEELRDQFSQFGTVVSARVLYDQKGGKNRAYGFLSFQSVTERDAALALDGEEFHGRILVVRKGVNRKDQS